MATQNLIDRFVFISMFTLVVLTALGNALALLLASLFGVAIGMLLLRRNVTINGILWSLFGCTCAVAFSLFRLMHSHV